VVLNAIPNNAVAPWIPDPPEPALAQFPDEFKYTKLPAVKPIPPPK
jgi:hypothetical protein